MINVYFYGSLRALMKTSQMKYPANSVKDLIEIIHNDTGISCKSELKNAITFVNDVNFLKLKRYKTPLEAGDKVTFLSPASGG